MVRLEDGIPMGVSVDTFPVLDTFEDFMKALYAVYNEEHGYKTLVIDSISELQRLIFDETCRRGDEAGNVKSSIEGFGYGKGYLLAKNVMQEVVEAVEAINRERVMNIVLIAHAAVQSFNDPESESYDRWTIDMHKQLAGIVERHADGIFLVKTPIDTKSEDQGLKGKRAIASGARVRKIYTEGTPAMIAKNRFGLPPDLRYDKGKGYAALAPYLPAQQTDQKGD
jgi:hypothetical protein